MAPFRLRHSLRQRQWQLRRRTQVRSRMGKSSLRPASAQRFRLHRLPRRTATTVPGMAGFSPTTPPLYSKPASLLPPNGHGAGVWKGGAALAAVRSPTGTILSAASSSPPAMARSTRLRHSPTLWTMATTTFALDLTNGVLTTGLVHSVQSGQPQQRRPGLGSAGAVLLPLNPARTRTTSCKSESRERFTSSIATSWAASTGDRQYRAGIRHGHRAASGACPPTGMETSTFGGRNDDLKAFSVTAGKLSAGPNSVGPDESWIPGTDSGHLFQWNDERYRVGDPDRQLLV